MASERIAQYKYQLHLTFFANDADVVSLSDRLPPDPYSLANKGSRDAERVLPRTSLVSYRSAADGWDASLELHWQNFATRFEGFSEVFRSLRSEGKAILLVVVDGSDEDFTAQMHQPLVKFCCDLDIALECEILMELDA